MTPGYQKGYHDTLRRAAAGNVKRMSALVERCIARGWIERTPEWKYELTPAGREQLGKWSEEAPSD